MAVLLLSNNQKYWPKKGPAVMLGPWCDSVPIPSESGMKIHKGKVVKNPNDNFEEIIKNWKYVQSVYSDLLLVLAETLNSIHKVNYRIEIWEIIIGPWLFLFSEVVYDRMERIKQAKKDVPDLKVIGLQEDTPTYIFDTDCFGTNARYSDDYNFKLMTKIIKEINIPISKIVKKNLSPLVLNKSKKPKVSTKQFISNFILHKTQTLFYNVNSKFFHNRSVSFKRKLWLIISSFGRIKFVDGEMFSTSQYYQNLKKSSVLNNQLRCLMQEKLMPYKKGKKGLYNVLLNLIPEEIPLVFLECFYDLRSYGSSYCNWRKAKKIISSTGWLMDDSFKIWSAMAKNNHDAQLIGIQHGGDYGIIYPMHWENHELRICDKYHTFGWSENQKDSKIIKKNIQLLTKKPLLSADKERHNILYTLTRFTKWGLLLSRPPELLEKYLLLQKDFISNLDANVKKKLLCRLYPDEYYSEAKSFLENISSRLIFSNSHKLFYDELVCSRISVFDHLSTTYAISLSLNIPTIIFYDPGFYNIREESKPYFKMLFDVNILHHSAYDAAKWLNCTFKCEKDWWFDSDTQNAVQEFRKRFGYFNISLEDILHD